MKTRFACLIAALLAPPLLAVDRDRIENADYIRTVTIEFNGSTATVDDAAGVTITQGANPSQLAITSTLEGVEYRLSGSAPDGYLEITSTHAVKLSLEGLDLTSSDGPALSVLTEERTFVELADGSNNSLADSTEYVRTGSGTLYSLGKMIFSGGGNLNVAGNVSHAIFAGKSMRQFGGDITVPNAVKDALHPKDSFRLDGGSTSLNADGDAVDAENGVTITGGRLDITSTVDDAKGITTDEDFKMRGGLVTMRIEGDQSKAISTGIDFKLTAGTLLLDLHGDVVLETVVGETLTYTDPSYCTGVKCDGELLIEGGSLAITHTGLAGKGLSADGNIVISGGALDIATSGGLTASYTDDTGAADTAASDGIVSDLDILISGGDLIMRTDGQSADAIFAKNNLTVSGGSLAFLARGNQSKGLKSRANMEIAGGDFTFALSGGVILETVTTGRYDPSYATAIKCAGDLTISGGTATIVHSGVAGKGVSGDGSIVMTGGDFDITTSGSASSTFTNSSGTTDRAAADCFKADGNLTITGGSLTTLATGTAGDAISCDGVAVVGTLGNDATPLISATVTGSRVTVSGSDYANCKSFKATGNFTMNGGHYVASTSTQGSEGLESKAQIFINGGQVEITSYDDSINAANKITITGGSVYCYASNNDGIDSNGTILVSGGLIVSSGANAPEEGFDCDQNNFTITGGIMVGAGGATSTPTASTSTQRSVLYKGTGTQNVILTVTPSSGDNLVFVIPRTYSGGGGGGPGGGPGGGGSSTPMTLLFSNAELVSGTTYTIKSGSTVSGGTQFHGLYRGATVTGGTTLRTFNPTAMVTTVQ